MWTLEIKFNYFVDWLRVQCNHWKECSEHKGSVSLKVLVKILMTWCCRDATELGTHLFLSPLSNYLIEDTIQFPRVLRRTYIWSRSWEYFKIAQMIILSVIPNLSVKQAYKTSLFDWECSNEISVWMPESVITEA